jgi:hypothetical protein
MPRIDGDKSLLTREQRTRIGFLANSLQLLPPSEFVDRLRKSQEWSYEDVRKQADDEDMARRMLQDHESFAKRLMAKVKVLAPLKIRKERVRRQLTNIAEAYLQSKKAGDRWRAGDPTKRIIKTLKRVSGALRNLLRDADARDQLYASHMALSARSDPS